MRSRTISTLRSLGWPAWAATLVLFALLCAIAAHWAMVLLAPRAPIAPFGSAADLRALPQLQQASQLFGLSQPVAPAALITNVQVVGIVAAGIRGSAILSIDGKPARTYAVGEPLSPSQRLLEVRSDIVIIGSGGERFELAAPTTASIAVLTSGANQPQRPGAPGAQPPVPIPGVTGLPASSGMSGVPGMPPVAAPGQILQPIMPAPIPAMPSGALPPGIVPVMPDGQPTGAVTPDSGASAAAAAGGPMPQGAFPANPPELSKPANR